MRFTGEHTLAGSPEQVWDALLDPEVLVRAVPGCDRLVVAGEHHYDLTVTAGVAAVRGTYAGTCTLTDLDPQRGLRMRLRAAGSSGTVDATVAVRLAPSEAGTVVGYEADAVVGGMVGGVGQRMLGSVSRRMAGDFFAGVERALTTPALAAPGAEAPGSPAAGAPAAAAPEGAGPAVAGAPAEGAVFTAPPRPGPLEIGSPADFVKGVAVGAGLVVLGVLLGRRR